MILDEDEKYDKNIHDYLYTEVTHRNLYYN